MTAAHCVWFKDEHGVEYRKNGDLFFVSKIERNEETNEIFIPVVNTDGTPVLCYKMKPIYHNTRDICLLQIEADPINSGTSFSETIPVCPTSLMPNSSQEGYKIKVYQAPITLFFELNLLELDIEASEWCKAILIQKDRFFYGQTTAAPGSSGGPAINRMGYAVGIVVSGYIPALQVDSLPHDSDIDSVSQWSGKVSGSGQIAHYTKISMIDGRDHPDYRNLLLRL